jgi:colanic acid biosynthesis glycosyl transferase WcaI
VKIGMITQWYDPEVGSAAVPGAISRALAALGHEVQIITGFPNYPTGRLYPGYRLRPYQYESHGAIAVHRVPLLPSHDRSSVKRAANYLSFASAASLRLGILRSVDAWLVHYSPATAALPALTAKVMYQRPFVLLVQDLWPDAVAESGFMERGLGLNLTIRLLHGFCRIAYRNATAIAVTAPSMVKVLRERGVEAHKLSVVPNWVDEKRFRPVPRDPALAQQLGLTGFIVMYAGNLGDFQALDTVIEAADLLRDIEDLRIVLVGTGVAESRLRATAQSKDSGNLLFLGEQPVDRMASLMALSDVQLVSLQDRPLFRATLPSKVQAALASGRPMVAAISGDAGKLIQEAGAGLVVEPGDVSGLAACIRKMHELGRSGREEMGASGFAFYQRRLSKRVGSAELGRLMESTVTSGYRGFS